MMMGPTWSCSCRRHRWGCSGSQEQDPLLRFAWRGIDIIYVYVYVLSGGIIIIIWMATMTRLMRSTIFECEKHIFVSITFHAYLPGQDLVHVFGPGEHNWTALYICTCFLFCNRFPGQIVNFSTWIPGTHVHNFPTWKLNTWKSSWGCCLLPPDCCCLLSQKWWLNSYKRINVRTIQT